MSQRQDEAQTAREESTPTSILLKLMNDPNLPIITPASNLNQDTNEKTKNRRTVKKPAYLDSDYVTPKDEKKTKPKVETASNEASNVSEASVTARD